MIPCTYTADSAQFPRGTRVYVERDSLASAGPWHGSRGRVWASLRPDGSEGCYVYACDVAPEDDCALEAR